MSIATTARRGYALLILLTLTLTGCSAPIETTATERAEGTSEATVTSPPPTSVVIEHLPLPPTAPTPTAGSCDHAANANGTGCISAGRDGIRGLRTFTWDSRHLLAGITYAGASADSVFTGPQLILVKTDGALFPNGDGWKCLTCGVSEGNRLGANDTTDVSYPEAFRDGKRVKFGRNVLDCGTVDVIDCDPTANTTHIYPIRSPFPLPNGGQMRELRLHPDNEHLGWNQMFLTAGMTDATQFGAFGRMTFNGAANPPAYEVSNVSFLLGESPGTSGRFIEVAQPPTDEKPGQLNLAESAGVIGEFRGFTNDGTAALGIGTQESWNFDIFATDLTSGESTRFSRDPAYTDPVVMAPDDTALVLADGRVDNHTGKPGANQPGSDGRMYFASALPGVPPLVDLAAGSAIGNLYNNQYGLPPAPGVSPNDDTSGRRFFQPYVIELDERRSPESGQSTIHDGYQLNGGGDTTPGNGGISDPLWNAGADPAWSPDGTAIAYYQLLVGPPACAHTTPEPAPCPMSTEPGGRMSRLMIARLTDREPLPPQPQPQPVPDSIPWGLEYQVGDPLPPKRPEVAAGVYTLTGVQGSANVEIAHGPAAFPGHGTAVNRVKVTYRGYSSDGRTVVDGIEESIKETGPLRYTWHSDITLSGEHSGTRKSTGTNGFVVQSPGLAQPPTISGTMTTTLDGQIFTSPETGS